MREKMFRPGMLVYMAGILINLIAIFVPYIRYSFTHELYNDSKGSYSLIGINGIRDDFLGSGNPGLLLRIAPVLLILAVISGIVCVFVIAKGTDITGFIAFAAPALSIAGYLLIKLNSVVKSVAAYVEGMEESLKVMGYTGSGGYGPGHILIIVSIVFLVIGAVMVCLED